MGKLLKLILGKNEIPISTRRPNTPGKHPQKPVANPRPSKYKPQDR